MVGLEKIIAASYVFTPPLFSGVLRSTLYGHWILLCGHQRHSGRMFSVIYRTCRVSVHEVLGREVYIRFPKVLITFAILLACYCFKSISHLKMHPTLSILILMLNDFLPPNKLAVYKSIESFFYNLKSQPIHQQYIKLHIIQGEALHEEAIRFSERYPMNQCVGCIDGTHVPIRRPTRNPHAFICRKGFYPLNVLVSFKPLN